MNIEVLSTGSWAHGGGVFEGQKLYGQVTKCRAGATVFYVRENLDSRQSFHISSAERWREKGGNHADGQPSHSRQCLDLCAPAGEWERIAELVRAADAGTLKRPVFKNRNFTVRWAERQLRIDDGMRAKH